MPVTDIEITIEAKPISGQGKTGFSCEAKLGNLVIAGLIDTSGKTKAQVEDDCEALVTPFLPKKDVKYKKVP